MTATCPNCGCTEAAAVHAIAAALAEDDLDRALTLDSVPCPRCSVECRHRVEEARDARVRALAARERYRARQARLQRRAQERATARAISAAPTGAVQEAKPGLPSAAAAALARAKARAAERRKP
jgi:hypothetical protein